MKKIIILLSIGIIIFLGIECASAVSVEVTEVIPGANCSGGNGKVTCNIPNGFGAVSGVIGEIIKYFTYIASLSAVLFIVINGILYSMSGLDESLKTGAKERIKKTLVGLALLMLSGAILNAVAPWVYK